MKTYQCNRLYFLFFAIFTTALIYAAPPYAPGLDSDWNHDAGAQLAPQVDLGGAGTGYWAKTFSNVPAGREFKITKDNNWDVNWGKGDFSSTYWIYDNTAYSPPQGGNNLEYKESSSATRLFLTVGNTEGSPANLPLHVQRLSADPVSVSWNGDSIGSSYVSSRDYGAGSNYMVFCTIGASRPTEQKIYLRYSTNNWTSSIIEDITGGSSQTTVTGQFRVPYGATFSYYLLSSTHDTNGLSTDTDLKTITYDTRTALNYTVTGWLPNKDTAFAPGQYTSPELPWNFTVFNQFNITALYGDSNSNYWQIILSTVSNSQPFKITYGPSWTTNWGGIASLVPNTTNSLIKNDAANASFDNTWGNDVVASIMIKNPQDNNTRLPIGLSKLSDYPTQITNVADAVTDANRERQSGIATPVTARVDRATILTEETVYIRWSTNNWTTHFVVPMAKSSDAVYVGNIPAMIGTDQNTVTTEYYIVGSTLDATTLGNGNNELIDLMTTSYKLGVNNKNFLLYTIPEPVFFSMCIVLFGWILRRNL